MASSPAPDQHVSEDSIADNEARREVLKAFGRYAAAAPTAMLILAPRQGAAGPKDDDKKDKDKKDKDNGGYS